MDHLGGGNINEMNLDVALTTGSHCEFVEDLLGRLINAKDHNLIDKLGGTLDVKILVADGLCDSDFSAIVVVADLCSLVMSVVVVLTIIEVKMAAGLGVHAHLVGVDLKTDWVINCLKQRLAVVMEVQDREDGAASHEGALLLVANWDDVHVVVGIHLQLGVDVVPLGSGREVDLDLGGAAGDGVLSHRVANLGRDKDVGAEHELVVQVEGLAVLGELVPHGADDGETVLRGLEEQVVQVVGLSVPLLDGGKDGALDARRLEPRLTHLEALLRVGTEEGEVDTELVELHEEIILRNARVAWNVVAGVDNTGDTEAEEHVDSELNILELGVVAASSDSAVPLGAEEEGAREEERSLLSTVTAEETLEGCTLHESAIGVVDPTVLEDVTISSHVGVVHRHSHLPLVGLTSVNGWLVHVVPDAIHVVGALEDRGVEEILPVVAGRLVKEINPDGLASTALTLERLLGGGIPDEEVGDVVAINVLALLHETLLVHEVVLAGTDVRISSNDETTSRVVDLVVQVHDVILGEALMVELTVVVVLGVLAVEPEDIDGEAVVGEVTVTLDKLVSRVVLPLGEVVSERVERRHGGVASKLGELLLLLLGIALRAQEVELESVALRDEGVVGLLAVMGVVQEDEGLGGVHPGDGSIGLVRVTSNVRDRAVEGLAVLALLLELEAVLVEETVRVIKSCLLKAEAVGVLRNTVHVRRVHSEVETHRVALHHRASLGGLGGSVLLVNVVVNIVVDILVNVVVDVVMSVVVHVMVAIDEVLTDGLVVDTEILGIVVEVIVVVDNDGLVAVHVLDDPEWVKLNLVADLVLTADKDTVIKKLDEILEVLLNLDLIPIDTDSSVGDGEALFFISSLNLDLHDTLLEESHVEIEVSSAVLHSVSTVVLVLVKVETGVDGVLMDHNAVWLDEVGSQEVVAAETVGVPLVGMVALIAVVVAGEHVAEARAVGLLAARGTELVSPLVVAMVAVGNDLAVGRGVVVIELIVRLVLGLSVVHEVLLVGVVTTVVMHGSVVRHIVHIVVVDRSGVGHVVVMSVRIGFVVMHGRKTVTVMTHDGNGGVVVRRPGGFIMTIERGVVMGITMVAVVRVKDRLEGHAVSLESFFGGVSLESEHARSYRSGVEVHCFATKLAKSLLL